MTTGPIPAEGALAIAELKEFASFPPGTQRYIRRSLDVGLERTDACTRWSRDVVERAGIRVQERVYEKLSEIRGRVPEDLGLEWVEPFMAPLVSVSAFDLSQDRLPSFSAYRFLYERPRLARVLRGVVRATSRPPRITANCGQSTATSSTICVDNSTMRSSANSASRW